MAYSSATTMDGVLLAGSTQADEARALVCPTNQSPARRPNSTQAPNRQKKDAPLQHSTLRADQDDAPPSYEKAVTPLASTLEGNPPMRVAALPKSFPCLGFEYLHDVGRIHFSLRGKTAPRAGLIRHHRRVLCRVNTDRAQKEPRWEPAFPGSSTRIMVPSPLDGIGPGEIERDVGKSHDWTQDWTFVLYMRTRAKSGELWVSEAWLSFRGVSPQSLESIPWNDSSRTMRVQGDVLPSKVRDKTSTVQWMKFTWNFQEKSDNPRWGGSFTVYYRERGSLRLGTSKYGLLATLETPWVFFDLGMTTRAEMDYRTGSGRFKKVMWHHRMLGYGNDFRDQPVEAWNGEHQAQYEQFVGRLIPRAVEGH